MSPTDPADYDEGGRGSLVRRQAAVIRLSHEISMAHDEAEVCQIVADGLRDEALGYEFLGIFLVDQDTGDRVLQVGFGWPEDRAERTCPEGREAALQPACERRAGLCGHPGERLGGGCAPQGR